MDVQPVLRYFLLATVTLVTMVNPLGVVPVFVSLTSGLPKEDARRVARRAVATALIVLVVFALAGQLVFRFFGVSVDSLRVVGGIIFFVMGYEMLQARLSRTRHDEAPPADYAEDIALTPIGIPMIAGPGAITSVVLLWSDASDAPRRVAVLLAAALVLAGTLAALLGAERVQARLGPGLNKVQLRIMGLITMMIAVEFFFAGLKPLVRQLLAP